MLRQDIATVVRFMRSCGVRARYFIQSLALSLALALFSLYTVSLLFPLVRDIISGDFSNVRSMSAVGLVARAFSGTFSTSISLFLLLVAWVYLTVLAKNALQYSAFLSTTIQARRATIRLRERLIDACLSFGKRFYDAHPASAVHRVIMSSTATIEAQFKLFQSFIIQMLLLVMYLGAMLYISWKLTILSVVVFPIIYLVIRSFVSRIKAAAKEAEAASRSFSERVMDVLRCMPVVNAFTKESVEREAFREASEQEIQGNWIVQKYQSLVEPIEDIGSTTGILILACGMALVLYLDHSLVASQAFVFFYIASRLLPALNSANDFRIGVAKAAPAVAAIEEILAAGNESLVIGGSAQFKSLVSGIEVKNLTFSYDPSRPPALSSASFHIQKGKTTAIVGPTGSGKSTIASLLLRMYDCPPGTIFFDGKDVRGFETSSLRNGIASVTQDILLFRTTIAHNIGYGAQTDPHSKKVETAAQGASAHEFISKLPDNYGTAVADRGGNLSGGEKQRIAIARALIRDADIVIMDEATSSLDARTEEQVMDFLAESARGKTVIIISHRLSAIRHADAVVYIEKGTVKEVGTPDELMRKKGLFYRHWETQPPSSRAGTEINAQHS